MNYGYSNLKLSYHRCKHADSTARDFAKNAQVNCGMWDISGLLPETEQTMSTFEEKTMTSLQSLFAKVDTLSRFNIRDILKPDVYDHYEQTLQEAYDALNEVEDALTTLGMKLEYQHFRLGGAVDELKPLMIQPHSPSDRIMEVFERRFS